MKTTDYHHNPTEWEMKFGEGVIHYLTVDVDTVRKPNGDLKKWFRHTDGLRYYY